MSDPLTPEQWQRVGDLFDRLVTVPRPERSAILEREAATDTVLRDKVSDMLREADADESPLDAPAASLLGPESAGDRASIPSGTLIGAYRVRELVGRGGMGEVYRAERADGQFEQEVALKLIRTDAIEALERFHAERRILARLEHPGIARLYDGGVHTDGRPWMVMEWVQGRTITDWVREHQADLAKRLDIFMQVCEAVACAHRNLLVHRDLKPSNVLVTPDGRVKLLDFGIAKRLAEGDGELTINLSPMTPAYAAPEQLAQQPVTTATDIYTLGILLFELLTGERPWQTEKLTMFAAMSTVVHEAPPSPSSVVAGRVGSRAPVPVEAIRGDLDAIVAKALRKEPERRYATVAEFQADIARHLDHQPVLAREGARLYVATRLLQRYRWAVAAVAALVITLAAGLGGVAWQAQVARRHAEEARVQAATAQAVDEFLEGLFRANSTNQPDPVKARATTARELLDIGAKNIDAALQDAPQAKYHVLTTLTQLYREMDVTEPQVELNRKRVALAETTFGRDSRERASALIDLGEELIAKGTKEEQKAAFDEAGATLDRMGDHTSDLRASYEASVADFYYRFGGGDALPHIRTSTDLLRALGPSHDLFVALNLEAKYLIEASDYAGARKALEEAVALSQKMGENAVNDDLMETWQQLGFIACAMGDLVEGEQYLRRAVEHSVAFNGEVSMDTVMALHTLGTAFTRFGRLEEAIDVLQRARRDSLALAKGDGPNIDEVSVIDHLADAQIAYGHLDEAAATLAEAEAMRAQLNVSTDAVDANLQERHASLALETGDLAAASAALDRSAAIFAKLGFAGSATARDTVTLRARWFVASGNPQGAVKFLEDNGRWKVSASGFGALEGVTSHAELTLATGDAAGAAREASDALPRVENSPGRPDYRIYEMRLLLVGGRAMLASGSPQAAVPLLEKALALARSAFDPKRSPVLADVTVALGLAQLAAGNREAAASLAAEAAQIQSTQPKLAPSYKTPLADLRAKLAARA